MCCPVVVLYASAGASRTNATGAGCREPRGWGGDSVDHVGRGEVGRYLRSGLLPHGVLGQHGKLTRRGSANNGTWSFVSFPPRTWVPRLRKLLAYTGCVACMTSHVIVA